MRNLALGFALAIVLVATLVPTPAVSQTPAPISTPTCAEIIGIGGQTSVPAVCLPYVPGCHWEYDGKTMEQRWDNPRKPCAQITPFALPSSAPNPSSTETPEPTSPLCPDGYICGIAPSSPQPLASPGFWNTCPADINPCSTSQCFNTNPNTIQCDLPDLEPDPNSPCVRLLQEIDYDIDLGKAANEYEFTVIGSASFWHYDAKAQHYILLVSRLQARFNRECE